MNDVDCKIYDLVEYKLKRYIDSFYQGSEEWSTGMHVLLMYLQGEVEIRWCKDGMIVAHPPFQKVKKEQEQKRILLSNSGSIGGV